VEDLLEAHQEEQDIGQVEEYLLGDHLAEDPLAEDHLAEDHLEDGEILEELEEGEMES
jgi:hypothetical protein